MRPELFAAPCRVLKLGLQRAVVTVWRGFGVVVRSKPCCFSRTFSLFEIIFSRIFASLGPGVFGLSFMSSIGPANKGWI